MTSRTRAEPVALPPPLERRRLRELGGLSRGQVAVRLSVSRETVRSWETGRTEPRGRRRQTYAAFLTELAHATAKTEPEPEPVSTAQTARPIEETEPVPVSMSVPASEPEPEPDPDPEPVSVSVSTAEPVPVQPPQPVRLDKSALLAEPAPPAEPTPGSGAAPATPADAFAALYSHTAPPLLRQAYLLTGRPRTALDAVLRAFRLAWQRWPEVAVDRDPGGWVRAAAYDSALSPWNRYRPRSRGPRLDPGAAGDAALLSALLSLAPPYRRSLLLYEGVGLDLPETAAETEASTPACANRLLYARHALTERLPELAEAPEELTRRLREFVDEGEVPGGVGLPPGQGALAGAEETGRRQVAAALALTGLVLASTAYCLVTVPDHYEGPGAPGVTVSGVPAKPAPGPLSAAQTALRDELRARTEAGPGRLTPQGR